MASIAFSVQIGEDLPVRIGFDRGAGVLVLNRVVKLWTVGRPAEVLIEANATVAVDGLHQMLRWKLRTPAPGERIQVTVGGVSADPPSSVGEIASFEVEHPTDEPGLKAWPASPTSGGGGWRLETTTGRGQRLCLRAERQDEKVGVMVTARVPSDGGATVSEVRAYETDGATLTAYRPVPLMDGVAVALALHAPPAGGARG